MLPSLPLGDLADKLRPSPHATAGAVLHSVAALRVHGFASTICVFCRQPTGDGNAEHQRTTTSRITDVIVEQLEAQSRGSGPGAETAAAHSCPAPALAKHIAGSTS